jgi:hypothetical protein
MGKVFQYLKSFADNVVGFLSFDIDDKADPTRILLVLRIVEPLSEGKTRTILVPISFKE